MINAVIKYFCNKNINQDLETKHGVQSEMLVTAHVCFMSERTEENIFHLLKKKKKKKSK